MEYLYLYALAGAVFKIVPVVSTWMIGALAALQLYFSDNFYSSIILFVAYFYIDSRLANDIFSVEV